MMNSKSIIPTPWMLLSMAVSATTLSSLRTAQVQTLLSMVVSVLRTQLSIKAAIPAVITIPMLKPLSTGHCCLFPGLSERSLMLISMMIRAFPVMDLLKNGILIVESIPHVLPWILSPKAMLTSFRHLIISVIPMGQTIRM